MGCPLGLSWGSLGSRCVSLSVITVWECVLCLGADLGLSLDLDLDMGCAPEGVGSS